jgi:hypothetical protein
MHYSVNRDTNAYIVNFGPNRTARLQHVGTGLDPGIELDIDPKEYEGIWFDSNDVEGYLLELGIEIDPRASFAEATVADGGLLMQLLRKNGVITDPKPRTTPTIDDQSKKSSNWDPQLFQELGMPADAVGDDMATATGWLMGSGSRTPEFVTQQNDFLASGWNQFFWNSSDTQTDTVDSSSQSLSPENAFDTLRKITVDVGGLIDCKLTSNLLVDEL